MLLLVSLSSQCLMTYHGSITDNALDHLICIDARKSFQDEALLRADDGSRLPQRDVSSLMEAHSDRDRARQGHHADAVDVLNAALGRAL